MEGQYCARCGGEEQVLLGVLGHLVWFRCRACGYEMNETLTHVAEFFGVEESEVREW